MFIFLPARAHDAREKVEGPLDGIASLTFAEAEGVLEDDAEQEAERATNGQDVLADRTSVDT